MLTNAGVWIDRRKALVVQFSDAGEEIIQTCFASVYLEMKHRIGLYTGFFCQQSLCGR